MPVPRVLQSGWVATLALFTLWGVGVGACAVAAARDPAANLRHPAVTGSAAVTVGWMLAAWGAMLLGAERVARLAWSLGWLALVGHLGLAFGLSHRWSHQAAVEHVREVGGSGAGIAVNYLFALVWGADVLRPWANGSRGEAARRTKLAQQGCDSRRSEVQASECGVSRAGSSRRGMFVVHGFLAFVVVNAAVVFGPPERRLMYAVALGLLVVLWGLRRR